MTLDNVEVVKDEYVLFDGDAVVGSYPSITEVVEMYLKSALEIRNMKLRHRLTVYTDNAVDCSELV